MNGQPNLSVEIGGIRMKNPVITASGCCGIGIAYADLYDPGLLGAVTTKGITIEPWAGNRPPRVIETPSGMLNSIGVDNPGVEAFIAHELPRFQKYEVTIIANVAGHSADEYVRVIRRLDETEAVAGYELNISCPNLSGGGMAFGTDPKILHDLVSTVRRATGRPLVVKLTPNVTDIRVTARAAEEAGADALSVINTLRAMSVDVHTRKPKLGSITGGLSGPAVRPVAVYMVWQAARTVRIPVIGMGGIMTAEDALEFFLVGARAVSIGTANFVNPKAPLEVIEGLERYLVENGLDDINDVVGKVILPAGEGAAHAAR